VNLHLAPVLLLGLASLLRFLLQPGDWRDSLVVLVALWFGYSAGASSGLRSGRIEVVKEILQRGRRGRVMFERKAKA
jgi:uncharacterized membrane protein YjjP (DUF1212 family)